MSLLSLNHVVAVAHRGGSALRPENTGPACDHGVALGADWLECDIHLSLDGEAVVLHDSTLDRTTDATGAEPDGAASPKGASEDANDECPPPPLPPWSPYRDRPRRPRCRRDSSPGS